MGQLVDDRSQSDVVQVAVNLPYVATNKISRINFDTVGQRYVIDSLHTDPDHYGTNHASNQFASHHSNNEIEVQ